MVYEYRYVKFLRLSKNTTWHHHSFENKNDFYDMLQNDGFECGWFLNPFIGISAYGHSS